MSEDPKNKGVILENALLRHVIPFRHSELSFKQFNLFIGKNGSGKSNLFKLLSRNYGTSKPTKEDSDVELSFSDKSVIELEQNANDIHSFFSIEVPYQKNSIFFPEVTAITQRIQPASAFSQMEPFTKLEYDDELMKEINKRLSLLFGREIQIRSIEQRGRVPFYKKNGVYINPDNDGTGIKTSFPLIELLLFQKNTMIFVEEPTAFLHPSVIPDYLKIIFELTALGDNQLFMTTHDILTSLQFFKGIYEKNPNISIHRFEDNYGEINITSIDQENVSGSLDEFLGNFPFPKDIEQLKDMSGCYP